MLNGIMCAFDSEELESTTIKRKTTLPSNMGNEQKKVAKEKCDYIGIVRNLARWTRLSKSFSICAIDSLRSQLPTHLFNW